MSKPRELPEDAPKTTRIRRFVKHPRKRPQHKYAYVIPSESFVLKCPHKPVFHDHEGRLYYTVDDGYFSELYETLVGTEVHAPGAAPFLVRIPRKVHKKNPELTFPEVCVGERMKLATTDLNQLVTAVVHSTDFRPKRVVGVMYLSV